MSEPTVPPPARRYSIPAIVAFVAGMTGWLIGPAVVAVISGIIALRGTRRDPSVRGRGLAIAGMVIGVISGVGMSIMVYSSYRFGLNQVTTLTPLVVNAAVDNNHGAVANQTTMTPEQLGALRDRVAGWGRITTIKDPAWTGRKIEGQPEHFALVGTAIFDQAGAKPFEVVFDAKHSDVKVVDVTFK